MPCLILGVIAALLYVAPPVSTVVSSVSVRGRAGAAGRSRRCSLETCATLAGRATLVLKIGKSAVDPCQHR